MTAATGNAVRMELEIAHLARRHGVTLKSARIIPLSAPIDYTADIEGLASTVDVDLGRQKFRAWAFSNLCLTISGFPWPPLLYRHDPQQVAGQHRAPRLR